MARLLGNHKRSLLHFGALLLFAFVMLTVVNVPAALAGTCPDGSDPIAGVCKDEGLFDTKQNVDLNSVTDKVMALLTWAFGIAGMVFVGLVAKNGFAMAKSGDNPQARAQAQAALWANLLGGLIMFGAGIIASIVRSMAG